MLIDHWAVQDGLGIVLVQFFFRLVVWVRFFVPLGLLLGSFWGAPGAIFGLLGANFRFVGAALVFFVVSFSLLACRFSHTLIFRCLVQVVVNGARQCNLLSLCGHFGPQRVLDPFSRSGFSLCKLRMLHWEAGPADCALRD